jgi:hypothetical protein
LVVANRLRKQAARCAALAKQTHDDEARQRYLRLEQMYLQMADAEERADSAIQAAVRGNNFKPAA